MVDTEEMVMVYVAPKINMDNKLQVMLLSPTAKLPTKGTSGAAGYDLFAAAPFTIEPWSRACINTDIGIIVPVGTYGRIAGRSGLALKGLTVAGGVIDRDYRGNVGVILYNLSDDQFTINIGDRVAQLILEKIDVSEVVEVSSLEPTERGDKGFGSSGK